MAATLVVQRDWLTMAVATQKQIESTNARMQKEWVKISGTDSYVVEGTRYLDASDWKVGNKAVGARDRRVASILWRLDAIVWRLSIINNWLDTVTERLYPEKSDDEGTVRGILLDVKPSLEEIGIIFHEIRAFISQVKALIKELRYSWVRWGIIGFFFLSGTVGAGALGVAIGSLIANWAGV